MSLASRFGRTRTRTEHRSASALTNDEIRRFAPSILADGPHLSRSARYTHLPTVEILDGLRGEGFHPFMVAQSRTRDESRREFTKHLVRLRHASQIQQQGETPEIILINSHDGSSSFQLLAGCFRFVCANGLIVGDEYADVRVQHKGDVKGEVIEGAYRVLGEFDRVRGEIEGMKGTHLSQDEQLAFGRAALALRYEEGQAPISEYRVIESRRSDDEGSDLWRVFNRAQESLVRGGQLGRRGGRRARVREITGIDQSVGLNRALWVLAGEMQKLRSH